MFSHPIRAVGGVVSGAAAGRCRDMRDGDNAATPTEVLIDFLAGQHSRGNSLENTGVEVVFGLGHTLIISWLASTSTSVLW